MGDDATVKVAVRVRPVNKREIELNAYICVDMKNNDTFLENRHEKKARKKFTYDHCFWSIDPNNTKFASQVDVFDALGKGVLESSFNGYNACIFAYGQTGSGKSYTMMGASQDETLKGIIPRLCDNMFARIADNSDSRITYKVEVSYMEIYCERVRDLLCGKETKHNLKVREHKTLGPYVEGLSTLAVRSFWDIESIMVEGNKSRTVAATQMNAESSRSHAVFTIVLTQTLFDPETNAGNEKVSRISLVDLAGSERAGKTGALGDRLKEGSNINKSLHTLGLVISALAELSAGKKIKGTHVPYRDSTLTWLLKDSLGGNSKTVMVATVSPASDNYEETLSTLRYADRAKKIVNHAVVNEDPNSKVIRELREEVEKLRLMLQDQAGLGPTGAASNPASDREVSDLMEKLSVSENLMQAMSKTWEQKLAESEKLHEERQKVLEDMGISVKSAGIGVQRDKFYFVNLNADPIMSELLVCYLKPHTKIGRPDADIQQDIQLKGLGIQPEHCVVEVNNPEVYITPLPAARTLVNGKVVTERTKLCHGYRVLLGNNHFFRLSCPKKKIQEEVGTTPGQPAHRSTQAKSQGVTEEGIMTDPDEEIDEEVMNYDFAMKEVILNELDSDPDSVYQQMKHSMEQQHIHEKQDALEQQKVRYEKQLAELRDQLQEVGEQSSTASPSKRRITFSPLLEAEWEIENRQRVMDTYFRVNNLVREANMLSEALDKDTVLKVTMQIPPSLLSPIVRGDSRSGGNEIAVRVLQKARGIDSVWNLETLEEKVVAMRELFLMQDEGKYPTDNDTTMDPFFDIEQHVLLGVANIFMQCLFHRVCHEYDAPIIGPTGKVCGSLRLSIERVPVPIADETDGDDEMDYNGGGSGWEVMEELAEELVIGCQIGIKVHIIEATGLPSAYCHFVFGQYKVWGHSEPTTIAPLQAFSPAFSRPEKVLEGKLKFDHTQVYTVEVTEEFLDYLQYGTLSVEVYGHRKTGFSTPESLAMAEDDRQHKTFPERCHEVMKNLEMWVSILELNDQGNYVPVAIEEKRDVRTGGVYVLRQGQSRRIQVKVTPVTGSGDSPLQCAHITSISIGSIYLRNRTEEPLDSYQEIDLDRLRGKWADALMRRRDYLDKELRKIMERKERNKVDNDKEQELIDQWTVLLMERSILLQPKPGSGVPGAPNRWKLPPGMELRVTTLYLDLNDDMLTPCDDDDPLAAITTAPLLGEKDKSMMNLVLIKSNEAVPEATASWDSSVHDAPSLNRPTNTNDRVYAILKVGVMLTHPPGIELVLRKRICLRVVKKVGGFFFMKLFAPIVPQSETGMMYEVVTGIPKLEGVFRPPKIPSNHPSFVEIDENENIVDKFKDRMMSVRNTLALDRLKQEVSLKEKLATIGKLLHTSHTATNIPEEETAAKASSSQPESQKDAVPTPPPQGEFPDQSTYLTTQPNISSHVGPEPQVIPDSPSEGDSKVGSDLRIPSINVTAGTPPLLLSETALVVEQSEATSSLNDERNNDTSVTEDMASVTEDTASVTEDTASMTEGTGISDDTMTEDTGTTTSVTEATSISEGTSVSEASGSIKETSVTTNETKDRGTSSTAEAHLPTLSEVAGLTEVADITQPDNKLKRQLSEKRARPLANDKSTRRRARSSERGLESREPSRVTKTKAPSSERMSRRRSADVSTLVQKHTADKSQDAVVHKNTTISEANKSDSDGDQSTLLLSPTHKNMDESPSLNSSRSSTSSLASVPTADEHVVAPDDHPPCTLGEKVAIETSHGFRFGKVKFIGPTEFSAGEWIGIALDRPLGKHDGTVKGVKYFKCKDKHGMFVRRDKIIRDPTTTGITSKPVASSGAGTSQHRRGSSYSPSTKRRISDYKT